MCAQYQVANRTQLLLWLTNWCTDEDPGVLSGQVNEVELSNKIAKSWWEENMKPVLQSGGENQEPFYFIACNRVGMETICDENGVEDVAMFKGGSCVIKLRPEVEFMSQPAGVREQELIIATCNF